MPRLPSIHAAAVLGVFASAIVPAFAEEAPTPPQLPNQASDSPVTGATAANPDAAPATQRPILPVRRGCDIRRRPDGRCRIGSSEMLAPTLQ